MNNLTFLGTGAADWDQNDISKNRRRLSSAIINDDLLIDAGPCIFQNDIVSYKNIVSVLQTHSHDDHFSADSLVELTREASKNITLFGYKTLEEIIPSTEGLSFKAIEPFCKTAIGNYIVTALPANHITEISDEIAFHYIIETKDGKTIYYGTDGAWILKNSWLEMKKHTFDVMIFDCTIGDVNGDFRIFEHNNINMIEIMCETIKQQGLLKENGYLLATHMARTLHTSHDELKIRLSKSNIIPAFDLMKIQF